MADSARKLEGKWDGLIEPGNLDLNKRPSVPNPDGGESSVFSMSIGIDGKEYLIPRVSEDGRLMGEDEAVMEFQKTGNHLGVFKTPQAATRYAESLHKQQASKGHMEEALKALSQIQGMVR